MKKDKISIKNRYTKAIIYQSETAKTIKECVEEAVKKGADLSKANLSEANLSEADLRKADLSEADLRKADLWRANLSKADLLFCKMDKKVFKQITEQWFEWKIED